ncbi:MAG: hypothetical protein SGI83_03545 [Bacteroidota bacterium]|nr:hypothetical protein [Bacteroidota bacterium]
MKGRSFLLRCAAFFLLLVFSQKAGAGLLLHNLFHTTETTEQTKANETRYSCTCIDDFMMPFDEAAETVYSHSVSHHTITLTFFKAYLPFITPVLSLLRGPPAIIA